LSRTPGLAGMRVRFPLPTRLMLDPSPNPSEDVRRAIFAALVEAQDRARSVRDAKQDVLSRFGITWAILERIEQEGLDNEWPPLDEGD
jgi:hypothetical protein